MNFNLDKEIFNAVFLQIAKYSNDEIILTDKDFNIVFHNSKFMENGKNLSLFEITNSIINKDIKENIINFRQSDKNHLFYKLIIKDNKIFQDIPVNFHICKINNSKKHLYGFCIIIQDVLQEIRNKIQKATFVDIISHDLKNPMRANIRILELILNNKFGEITNTLKPVLEELLNSCRFMNYMADNLLIKYRNESELNELQKEKCSIVQLVKNICNKLSATLEKKHQSIELIVKGNITDVDVDIKEISKVINNLAINASEQSVENSKIIIKIEFTQNNVNVSFIDYGYNQKKEILDNLFEEYIACSNKFRKIGFSLDLYNCKKIIEAHNGNISAKKQTNKGTSITFTLPAL